MLGLLNKIEKSLEFYRKVERGTTLEPTSHSGSIYSGRAARLSKPLTMFTANAIDQGWRDSHLQIPVEKKKHDRWLKKDY